MPTPYASPSNTSVGTYTKIPSVTVSNVAGLPTSASSGDACTRQADMSIWDTTNGVFVRPEQSSVGLNQ